MKSPTLRITPPLLATGLLCLCVVLASCGGDESNQPVSAEDCAGCHEAEAAAWDNDSSHKLIYQTCTFCHEEALPEPGHGHRTTPWCDACHSEQGHPPAGAVSAEPQGLLFITCTTCHDPMGSKNLYLIREQILVEPGRQVPVSFLNTQGKADASYAELSAQDGGENGKEPGSGLCEICHTSTAVYNRFGTGVEHFRSRCAGCHDHALAFGVDPACIACHEIQARPQVRPAPDFT
jgi:hypothetical protein